MKFNKTNDIYADLIQKLKTSGYSKSYVERLGTEINWLIRNQDREESMKLSDIDWKKEEIYIIQQKTGTGLALPMPAAVGNAIYDYLTMERPLSEETYIFLCRTNPYGRCRGDRSGKLFQKFTGLRASNRGKENVRERTCSGIMWHQLLRETVLRVL